MIFMKKLVERLEEPRGEKMPSLDQIPQVKEEKPDKKTAEGLSLAEEQNIKEKSFSNMLEEMQNAPGPTPLIQKAGEAPAAAEKPATDSAAAVQGLSPVAPPTTTVAPAAA